MPIPRRARGQQEAVELYRAGLSLRQVAHRLGVSYTAVKTRLRKAGVALRPARRLITNTSPGGTRARDWQAARRRRYLHPVPDQPTVRPVPRTVMLPP